MRVGRNAAKTLRVFALIWLSLFCGVWVLSAAFHIAKSPSLWGGIQDVMWWVAPWNIAGFVVNVVSLSPAIGAYMLAARSEKN